jgi:hypothetical protein
MISLGSLERRLSVLERPFNADIDLGELERCTLESLNDTELGLLDEFYSLLQSGFSFEEVSGMMGEESYKAAIAAIEKADREYKRLIEEARPKRHIAPLEPCKEADHDESPNA